MARCASNARADESLVPEQISKARHMSDEAIEFQIGDVVRLKSGGPAMTVTNVGEAAMTGKQTVWCMWFDTKGQQNGSFPLGAVEKDE